MCPYEKSLETHLMILVDVDLADKMKRCFFPGWDHIDTAVLMHYMDPK